MSGDGGSKNTTTTVQNSTPWNSKDLKFSTGEAKSLYNDGDMFKPYDQSMVVPFSSQTNQAMGQIQNAANQNFQPFEAANSNAADVLNNGGITGSMGGALDAINNVASGQNSINTGQAYQSLMNQAAGPSATETNLAGVAAGDNRGGNQALMESLGRGADDIAQRVNMEASAMGRGGSVAHMGALQNDIGNYYSDALLADDQYSRNEQMQANSMLDAQRNQGFTNQMAATSGQTGVQGANIANQMNAGQAAFGAGNQANQTAGAYAQMAPQLYQNQFAGADRLMQVGALNEDLTTRQMNDDYRQFSEAQNQDRQAIEWLNAINSGAGSLGSTGSSVATGPATSSLSSGLGGALGGATMGSAFGPWGTAIGGLGGGLAGLFG
jgi:hypothetical protein